MKHKVTLKELYEHRCSCGKLLEKHDEFRKMGTTQGWDYLKMCYDLKTCDFERKSIGSIPNGFGKSRDYFIRR